MKNILLGLISIIGLISPIAYAVEPTLPTVDSVEATALTIAPSIFESVVTPGKTTSQIFEIKNGSNFPLPIKSYIRTFDASDEIGSVTVSEEADMLRLAPGSWSQIVEPDFVLQPQTTRQVTVNFTPPIDLPPGGYYAIFFAEPLLPESFLNQSSLSIGGRLGSLLFLIGAGEIIEKGDISSYEIPEFLWNNQIEAKIRFQNLGNIHLRPTGEITVKNLLTKKSRNITVPEFTVLSGKYRQQTVSLGDFRWPGIYQTKLQLNYGRDKIPLETVVTFYYLPLLQFVAILLIVGIAICFIWHKPRKRIFQALRVIVKGEKSSGF